MVGPKGLAELVSVPVKTVYNWRRRGIGPTVYRVGGLIRYRRQDIEDWLADHAEEPPTAQ